MAKPAKTKEPISDKKKHNNDKEAETLFLKDELKKLYNNLENYFAINTYYEIVRKENPNKFARLLLSRVRQHSKILEYGINPGILSIEAAIKKAEVYGIDESPMKVVIAENLKHIEYEKFELIQKLDDINIPIDNILATKFKVMNFNNLEFDSATFDLIFSNNAILTGDLHSYLKEIDRCLDKNGEIILNLTFHKDLTFVSDKTEQGKYIDRADVDIISQWALKHNYEILFKETIFKGSTKIISGIVPLLKHKFFRKKIESEVLFHLKKK
jgi:2-polyprenyl-3-methyl-5-hydroxy-6-metoxy-1,4-benzoquinol methylase